MQTKFSESVGEKFADKTQRAIEWEKEENEEIGQ